MVIERLRREVPRENSDEVKRVPLLRHGMRTCRDDTHCNEVCVVTRIARRRSSMRRGRICTGSEVER